MLIQVMAASTAAHVSGDRSRKRVIYLIAIRPGRRIGVRAAERRVVSAGERDVGTMKTDVVVVGAGFAGLYMLHRLRQAGFTSRVFESGPDVGGTWYANRYPGARCDVQSIDYSYSFDESIQQDWHWSERYATQPEILRYLNFVADRLDLRSGITFDTRVTAASFDAGADRWHVVTDTGEEIDSRHLILAVGNLSAVKPPDIAGVDDFAGTLLHTANWPAEGIDVSGKRVGVIGTGSTGVQVIPILAQDAEHLTVFQRTPAFSVPARNRSVESGEYTAFKSGYAEHRAKARLAGSGAVLRATGKKAFEVDEAERHAAFSEQWEKGGMDFLATFNDLLVDRKANDTAADFVRAAIGQTVKDPEVARSLMPSEYPIGAKRLCLNTDFYETFNRPNVSLVDLRRDPIEEIVPDGIKTRNAHHSLDVLVLATGFDAITGPILRIDIRGVDGASLRDAWAAGPLTCLGIMSAGFPNLFFLAGPGSPSVLTNVVASIEQHVDWVANTLGTLRERGISRMEPRPDAVDAWVARVNGIAEATLFTQGASWYMGANVPGKPRVFMPYAGGLPSYRELCDAEAASGYPQFALE